MKTCDCGRVADKPALVSTIPGSGDGKLVWIDLCSGCYEREDWKDVDLAPMRDMWEVAGQQVKEDG